MLVAHRNSTAAMQASKRSLMPLPQVARPVKLEKVASASIAAQYLLLY